MQPTLFELFKILLKIGATSFGGPMPLISGAQKEIVEKRRWLDADVWMSFVALTSALPGPIAVNAITCMGQRLLGWKGAVTAWVAVLLPSALLMGLFAALSTAAGESLWVKSFFYTMPAAIAAIILSAAWGLRRAALKQPLDYAILGVALAVTLVTHGAYLTWTIGVAASIGLGYGWAVYRQAAPSKQPAVCAKSDAGRQLGWAATVVLAVLCAAQIPGLSEVAQVFVGFANLSVLMFGGGYSAVPLFHELAVTSHDWVDAEALHTAVALSQLTPGPVMSSSGFIGYQVAGISGHLAGTVGVFAPMAVVAVLLSQSMTQLEKAWWMRGLLKFAKPSALGGLAGAGFLMLAGVWPSALLIGLFGVLMYLVQARKVPVYYIIMLAAGAGLARHAMVLS